jgi:hypothetical protein
VFDRVKHARTLLAPRAGSQWSLAGYSAGKSGIAGANKWPFYVGLEFVEPFEKTHILTGNEKAGQEIPLMTTNDRSAIILHYGWV